MSLSFHLEFVYFFVCLLCLLPVSLLSVALTSALLGFLFLFLLSRWLRYVLSSLFTLLPFLRCGGSALRMFWGSGFSCLFCSASAFTGYYFHCFCVFALMSSSHLLGSSAWGSGIRIRLSVAPTFLCHPSLSSLALGLAFFVFLFPPPPHFFV